MRALAWSLLACGLAAWTGACNKSGGSTASTGGAGGCHEVATHERLFGVPTGAYGL